MVPESFEIFPQLQFISDNTHQSFLWFLQTPDNWVSSLHGTRWKWPGAYGAPVPDLLLTEMNPEHPGLLSAKQPQNMLDAVILCPAHHDNFI